MNNTQHKGPTMPKTSRLTVAEYLTKAIELSGKTQRDIAKEVGYDTRFSRT